MRRRPRVVRCCGGLGGRRGVGDSPASCYGLSAIAGVASGDAGRSAPTAGYQLVGDQHHRLRLVIESRLVFRDRLVLRLRLVVPDEVANPRYIPAGREAWLFVSLTWFSFTNYMSLTSLILWH